MPDFCSSFIAALSAVLDAFGSRAELTEPLALARALLLAVGDRGQFAVRSRELLKLTKLEHDQFIEDVSVFVQYEEASAGKGSRVAPDNGRLAMLRVLSWFETARLRGCTLTLPDSGMAREDLLNSFALLSTLELLMREVLRSSYREAREARARIEALLPAQAADSFKRSPQDPIAGLFLRDLIQMYVNAAEWERIDPIYRASAFLKLLGERRLTAERFLDDIRRMRNEVAHLRGLTALQHELLVRYYEELVEPMRSAYAKGQTQVDPARFERPRTQDELSAYSREALRELTLESRHGKRIAQASLAVSVVVLLLAMPVLWPSLRIKLDPDLAYLDALHGDRSKHGALSVQACRRGDLGALDKLATQPGADHALSGPGSAALDHLITTMAVREPDRLRRCLPALARLGWNANLVGGNTVGSLMGDARQEATLAVADGYRGYLAAHASGLVPNKPGTASELRCPVLVLAVWRDDVDLVSALVAAGAKPERPCIVDAIWLDGRSDGAFSSALTEARRMGSVRLLAALRN